MLKDTIFFSGMQKLEAAFMLKLKEPTLKVYYENLQNMTDKEFTSAVKRSLIEDKTFPLISRLLFKEWDA